MIIICFPLFSLADALTTLTVDNVQKCAQDGQNSAYEYGAVTSQDPPLDSIDAIV